MSDFLIAEIWGRKMLEYLCKPSMKEMIEEHPAEFLASYLPAELAVLDDGKTLRIVKKSDYANPKSN